MNKSVNFMDLPRDEMKDILISRVSGDEHEEEMYLLIATFTAYNLGDELYLEYFDGLETDEMVDELNSSFHGESWEKEDMAWNCAISTLGEKVLAIIEDFDVCMKTYLQITHLLESMRDTMFTIYTKI